MLNYNAHNTCYEGLLAATVDVMGIYMAVIQGGVGGNQTRMGYLTLDEFSLHLIHQVRYGESDSYHKRIGTKANQLLDMCVKK